MTRLGDFWKFWGAKFLTKVAQNIWPLIWAIVKNGSFTLNCCGYFLGYFLLQHLVTLGTIQNITASLITKSSSCYGQKSVSRGPASCRLKWGSMCIGDPTKMGARPVKELPGLSLEHLFCHPSVVVWWKQARGLLTETLSKALPSTGQNIAVVTFLSKNICVYLLCFCLTPLCKSHRCPGEKKCYHTNTFLNRWQYLHYNLPYVEGFKNIPDSLTVSVWLIVCLDPFSSVLVSHALKFEMSPLGSSFWWVTQLRGHGANIFFFFLKLKTFGSNTEFV